MFSYFDRVFNQETLFHLSNCNQNQSTFFNYRLRILRNNSYNDKSNGINELRRIWEMYLESAGKAHMFEGREGNDLIQRLRSTNDDHFRAALAECASCWFFSEKLGMKIIPRTRGRRNFILEFTALKNGLKINVEAKSPFHCEIQPNTTFFSDFERERSDLIRRTIAEASRKFNKNSTNIVAIYPAFYVLTNGSEYQYYSDDPEREIISALYARLEKLRINRKTRSIEPVYSSGTYTRLYNENGRLRPRAKRIGAVVSIIKPDNSGMKIYHNPYAYNPIPEDLFNGYQQYVLGMVWINRQRT